MIKKTKSIMCNYCKVFIREANPSDRYEDTHICPVCARNICGKMTKKVKKVIEPEEFLKEGE